MREGGRVRKTGESMDKDKGEEDDKDERKL